mmetsp:Transcript_23342/g.54219  ORF Transcript_23342/g.54219 Transcript_23342/m.54219 type:complete len:143 (-) Transcript_23342:851-1279(-)
MRMRSRTSQRANIVDCGSVCMSTTSVTASQGTLEKLSSGAQLTSIAKVVSVVWISTLLCLTPHSTKCSLRTREEVTTKWIVSLYPRKPRQIRYFRARGNHLYSNVIVLPRFASPPAPVHSPLACLFLSIDVYAWCRVMIDNS